MPRSPITLAPDERILRRPHIRWVAYLNALILFFALMVTGKLSGLATTELTLTSKRIIGKRGMVMRKQIDVPYAQVAGVKVKQGVLGKLFDYGTIIIYTRGEGGRIDFHDIAEPFDIQQQIEELSEIAVLGHTLAEFTGERF